MNDEKLIFLDAIAQSKFDEQRNQHYKLQWDKSKWIIDASEDESVIYLSTFTGDK
jgi:hypothetical protein